MSDLSTLFGTPHPVAIVTGSGAPRVGNVIARHLAARGYELAIHANSSVEEAERTVKELKAAGSEAIAVVGNLTEEETVKEIFAQIADHFGRLDVLVNAAAIWEQKQLEDVTAADVRKHFEINTLATFLCCHEAGKQMIGQEHGGAIVNIGDWAIVRPYRDYAAYFPSKGAIPAMTRSLAMELADRNPHIRVNAILPGPVMLPDDLPQEVREGAINATLVKREGAPENVADAASFLIENDFICGVCLPVDGGRSVYAPD